MKRSLINTEEKKFNAFETLNEKEMMQVRGGDSTPRTRDRDLYGDDLR